MDPSNPAPDLKSILRQLAASVPPQAQASYGEIAQGDTDIEEGEYEPSTDYDPSQPLIPNLHPSSQSHHPQQQRPPIPQNPAPPQPATKPSIHSPSTITTWPSALRHVTHLTSTSPSFTQHVSHLIRTQHTHERQWHTSRLALVSQLSTRSEKKRQLDSVLNSLGGGKTTPIAPSTTADLPPEKELEIFDRKVHKACREMVAVTAKELGRLAVPFLYAEGQVKGTFGDGELVRLQKKMLELLEDLCGEEERKE